MSNKRKRKPAFSDLDPIPTNPKTFMTTRAETPAEIAKRTGLNLHRLCEQLVEWSNQGVIQHGLIGTPGICQIPVFRIAI